MDILIIILALYGLGMILWGTGASLVSVFGSGEYKNKNQKDLPVKGSYRHGKVRVDCAYKDLKEGTFNAMVTSNWSGAYVWISATDESEFEMKLEQAIDEMERKSIEYKNREGTK